jgi:hypothetical protein
MPGIDADAILALHYEMRLALRPSTCGAPGIACIMAPALRQLSQQHSTLAMGLPVVVRRTWPQAQARDCWEGICIFSWGTQPLDERARGNRHHCLQGGIIR